MKRRLFSDKDGTTFKEDVADISEEVKAFFQTIPVKLKKLLTTAERFVIALQTLDDAIEEGQPADIVIDKILSSIKGDVDERIYEAIQEALHDFVAYITTLGQWATGESKMDFASDGMLQVFPDITKLEADTAIQLACYAQKS